jgi:hypothetical protein
MYKDGCNEVCGLHGCETGIVFLRVVKPCSLGYWFQRFGRKVCP